MRIHALALGAAAAALLSLGACNKNGSEGGSDDVQTPQAQKAAGNKTIAAGLPQTGQFMNAAKAAGLDQTLAGPGPYTVYVPTDQAVAAAPDGAFRTTPDNRAQLTGIITNLVLPGTVLVADIDKAIDRGKGKASLGTMGGAPLTASKDGGKTVLTDASGHKAAIVGPDQQFSNGVVHQIDGLLMPAKQGAAAPPAGDKAAK
jgi:uncharacterized surface protein with fasciclin (FAS1) repeats